MRERRLLLFGVTVATLTFLLVPNAATAGTCVSGAQSGRWTLARSPYIINNTLVSVPAGSTLVIEDGVTVMLKNGNGFTASIVVSGALITQDGPLGGVTFTGADEVFVSPNNPALCGATESQQPGTWGSIDFRDSDLKSRLQGTRILYGGTGNGSVVQVANNNNNTNVTIIGTLIAFGAGHGIWLNSGASPNILNTTIRDHAGTGIFHNSSNCEPVVSGCAILNNGDFAVRAFASNVKKYSDNFMSGNTPDAFRVWGGVAGTGTWEDPGVPYHVAPTPSSDNLVVSDGDTLTVEPGVEIRFGTARGLTVFGTLVARGDSCRRITFTGLDTTSTANYWGSISLNGSDPGTFLEYCDISYGGFQSSENVSMRDVGANVVLSDCRITNSAGAGIEVFVVNGTAEPMISNNWISDNALQGLNVVSAAAPILRSNLIRRNLQGTRLSSSGSSADLGTASDPGRNAFIDNTEWAVLSNASDTIFAVGNHWVDTDSAVIDTVHISDDDEQTGVGPVVFTPFDVDDRSAPPQPFPCPPSCQALAVTITRPTTGPTFQTSSRFLTLAGTAQDDGGVSRITWENSTTGESGEAELRAPRTDFAWTVSQIPLLPGENVIVVRAFDRDQCTAVDEVVVTFVAQPANCWALDTFDDLALGSLDGQNGWTTVPGRATAEVIANPFGTGQALRLEPTTDQPIIMEKRIVAQSDSLHILELLVLAEPGDTSLAKIEVKTRGNPNWDKKFQIFFGVTMRLNFGPTQADAVDFLARVEPRRWYHVKAVIDLKTDSVDIFLDEALVLDDIAVGPGAIDMLSISAWNLPGFVLFDDLRGCLSSPITRVDRYESAEVPKEFSLWQNFPNPFNPSTTIRFSLPEASEVSLMIYDVQSREVRRLVQDRYQAGTHSVTWDGRDSQGRSVTSGIYFVRMRAGEFVTAKRMLLVK